MPKLPKGSQEAKDYMKSIREMKKTTSNIKYETFKGKKSQKNITMDLEKDTQRLPSGDTIVKSTIKRKVDKPDDEDDEEVENVVVAQVPAKKGGRPKKYATAEEAKEAKRLQTLASNKKKYDEKKAKKNEVGGGKINLGKTFKTIGRTFDKGVKSIDRGIKNVVEDVKDYGKVVLYGRKDFPPKVRKILEKVGDSKVKSITICRTPVSSVLTGALSLFSLGKFGKRMERSFDELFHLFILLNMSDGSKVSLEKNEVINMDINPSKRDKTECEPVETSIPDITLDEMLDNSQKYMGKKRFFGYSAKDNNCQDFIVAFFKSNNIGDEKDFTFIKQDTKSLFKDLPYLRKFSNTITDLGAKVNEITTGAGIDNIKDLEKNNFLDNNIDMEGGKMIVIHHHHYYGQSKPDEDIEGGKITLGSIGKAFSKAGDTIKKGFNKEIAKPVSKITRDIDKKVIKPADKYITSKKGGLATDLIDYGIPATTGAILGALGTATGNPALGVIGSAAGSKLGKEVIAPAVHKASGAGMRKPKFAKGSQEAKDYMASIRSKKKGKGVCGGQIIGKVY
jgi:hypothetical protein